MDENPGLMQTETGAEGTFRISFGEPDKAKFLHLVREALRDAQYWHVALRRNSFDQIHQGIDRESTRAISKNLDGLSRYRWRCLVTGAIPTAKRLHRNKQIDIPVCQCCKSGEVEDLEHLLLRCPAHDHVRFREFTREAWEIMPNCLRFHGILPLQHQVVPDGVDITTEGMREYVMAVQHALLDALASRQRFCDWTPPQPRWVSARRGLT